MRFPTCLTRPPPSSPGCTREQWLSHRRSSVGNSRSTRLPLLRPGKRTRFHSLSRSPGPPTAQRRPTWRGLPRRPLRCPCGLRGPYSCCGAPFTGTWPTRRWNLLRSSTIFQPSRLSPTMPPMGVAVTSRGSLAVALITSCLELDHTYRPARGTREIPGGQGSAVVLPEAWRATPGGSLILKPTMGRDLYRVQPNALEAQRVPTGLELSLIFYWTALPDGSALLVDATNRKAYKAAPGKRRQELPLFPNPSSWPTAYAAGPDGSIWVLRSAASGSEGLHLGRHAAGHRAAADRPRVPCCRPLPWQSDRTAASCCCPAARCSASALTGDLHGPCPPLPARTRPHCPASASTRRRLVARPDLPVRRCKPPHHQDH